MGFCEFSTIGFQRIKEEVVGFFSGQEANRILLKHGITPASILSIHADVPDIGRFSGEYRNLSSVRLERGLFCIADSAFEDCFSLQDVFLPDHVPEFGKAVFSGCTSLLRIHLPNDMKCIPDRTFDGCVSLTKVFLADTVRTIGEGAFRNCRMLRSPWIPESIELIGDEAFFGCDSIGRVFIPENVKISDSAFRKCATLVIRGKQGSIAEEYAKANSIPFQIEE